MLCIGIDISKANFDLAFMIDGAYQNWNFSNDLKGFKELIKQLKPIQQDVVFCMEATGIYDYTLAKYLYKSNKKTIVVNPIKTHAFAKMEIARNKTDKADAQSISRYCQHIVDKANLDKNLFKPKNKAFESLQCLVTRKEQLNKMLNQENNRLQASLNQVATKSTKAMIRCIKKQILSIEDTIKTLVKSDSKLNKPVALLTSINGIGNITAWAILAYIGDISSFDNAKQVASFAGLNPKIIQSGSSINKSSLSKMRYKRLRKSLYMPALVATRCNPLRDCRKTTLKYVIIK